MILHLNNKIKETIFNGSRKNVFQCSVDQLILPGNSKIVLIHSEIQNPVTKHFF